jgi:signal transduction histidine kinase
MLDGELYIQSDSFLYSHETEGVLVVEVIDSGNGISKEGLKRIFDPFVGGD